MEAGEACVSQLPRTLSCLGIVDFLTGTSLPFGSTDLLLSCDVVKPAGSDSVESSVWEGETFVSQFLTVVSRSGVDDSSTSTIFTSGSAVELSCGKSVVPSRLAPVVPCPFRNLLVRRGSQLSHLLSLELEFVDGAPRKLARELLVGLSQDDPPVVS